MLSQEDHGQVSRTKPNHHKKEDKMTTPPGVPNLATPGERLIAALIDFGILIAVAIVVGILSAVLRQVHLGFVGALLGLANFCFGIAYFVYLWSQDNPWTGKGQTIGKKMRGIKIVKVDGSDLTLTDAIIRYIGYMISSFIVGLGFIWILIDANKQGWHDKIAKTYVVKV
jgi:uncharacterized RDD family membrane protein YckC